MKKYKVIAGICYSDLTRKIYGGGEVVQEDWFHEGHAEKLVADKFLEPIVEEVKEEVKEEAIVTPETPEQPETPAEEPKKPGKKK